MLLFLDVGQLKSAPPSQPKPPGTFSPILFIFICCVIKLKFCLSASAFEEEVEEEVAQVGRRLSGLASDQHLFYLIYF